MRGRHKQLPLTKGSAHTKAMNDLEAPLHYNWLQMRNVSLWLRAAKSSEFTKLIILILKCFFHNICSSYSTCQTRLGQQVEKKCHNLRWSYQPLSLINKPFWLDKLGSKLKKLEPSSPKLTLRGDIHLMTTAICSLIDASYHGPHQQAPENNDLLCHS